MGDCPKDALSSIKVHKPLFASHKGLEEKGKRGRGCLQLKGIHRGTNYCLWALITTHAATVKQSPAAAVPQGPCHLSASSLLLTC